MENDLSLSSFSPSKQVREESKEMVHRDENLKEEKIGSCKKGNQCLAHWLEAYLAVETLRATLG